MKAGWDSRRSAKSMPNVSSLFMIHPQSRLHCNAVGASSKSQLSSGRGQVSLADFGAEFGNSLLPEAISVLLRLCPVVDGNGFQQVNLLLRKTHNLEGNPRDLIAMHLATSRLL